MGWPHAIGAQVGRCESRGAARRPRWGGAREVGVAALLTALLAASAMASWPVVQPTWPAASAPIRPWLGGSEGASALTSSPPLAGALPETFEHAAWIGRGDEFGAWFDIDVEHLSMLARRMEADGGGGREVVAEVQAEAAFLRDIVAQLEANPSYIDAELGFSVYDARLTGWLHVSSIAARARDRLLARSSESALPARDALLRLSDGTPLSRADPTRLPEIQEVVETLRAMPLPRDAFAGYRIYLLPFSLGDTSGLGTDEYMLVGAAAAGRDVIADQIPVTVAHEMGHRIQLVCLGHSYWHNPIGWKRYMDARGIPAWSDDGEVNTSAWAMSPEETFAEDVRVLFGPERAASEPHGSAYGDPRRDKALEAEVRKVILECAATMRGRPVATGKRPQTALDTESGP